MRVEMVRRSLSRDEEDTSTWLAIGAAATQLNMACVNSFSFPIKIGGWTTVGRNDRIRVDLEFPRTRNNNNL